MNKAYIRIIRDDSLVDTKSILISLVSYKDEDLAINDFTRYYQKAIQKAKKHSLSKIQINFNHNWLHFTQLLTTHNFTPILTELKLDNLQVTKPIKSSHYSSKSILFSKISPILRQQAQYHHDLYPNYYRSPTTINWPKYQKSYDEALLEPNHIHITYRQDHLVRGFILGSYLKKRFYLVELVVDKKIRGLGIGTILIQRFIKKALIRGITKVYVETGYNQSSTRLYQRLGWQPVRNTWYKNVT